MRESERKRLVELIDKAHLDYVSFSTEMALAGNYDGVGTFGEFASKRLLDNGIVVPPVKVGETVYIITEISQTIVDAEVIGVWQCKDTTTIITNHGTIHQNSIGKTVFLTREEALQELEKRKEDGKNG